MEWNWKNLTFNFKEDTLQIKIHTPDTNWITQKHRAYLLTDERKLYFHDIKSISHIPYKNGIGEGILTHYLDDGLAFDTIIWSEYRNGTLHFEWIPIKEDKNIYYHKQFEAEKYISSFLFDFPYVEQPFSYIETLGDDIENIEDELHIEYEKIQKQAFHNFFLHPFSIITGGPGTGKTTIVQGLISLYKKYYPLDTIALCAPTGRASKRLSEICQNVKVSTIHSLLHWDLESNTFLKNEKELLDCDLLVIDEFSMVDQQLFQALLKSAKTC